MQSWFETLAAHCSISTLTKIEFESPLEGPPAYHTEDYGPPVDRRREYHITAQTVEPLLQFRNLEELVIFSAAGMDLDDSIQVFGRYWPRMRWIDLGGSRLRMTAFR